MNRLKKELFITLFTILSLFILTILFIFNAQAYFSERKEVIENLNRVSARDNMPIKLQEVDNRMFMDRVVYTITLDENNNIDKINNYSYDNSISNDIINKEVKKIVNKNREIYIGNLITGEYSYKYRSQKYIVLVDNTDTNNRLQGMLYLSLGLFLLSEIIIFILSRRLSLDMIKPAEESFEKQKRFIADASHELKTPLAVIMASADNAQKNKNKSKWINNIQSESERMNKLITSLLDLSKIEENSNETYEMNNLSKIVEKSVLTLESLIYEKNISLEYDIKEKIMFNSNSDEMKQLVSILLDNAIKHSIDPGKIEVKLYDERNNIYLTIKNKGNPIKKGEEEKIFERFYRSDESRNRDENRYGLGLAIAKSIVNKHNGSISASSTDTYTTFKVIFKKK